MKFDVNFMSMNEKNILQFLPLKFKLLRKGVENKKVRIFNSVLAKGYGLKKIFKEVI